MPTLEPLPPAPAGWEENDRLRRERTAALIEHGQRLQQQEGGKDALQRRQWAFNQTHPEETEVARKRHPFYGPRPDWWERAKALHAERREEVLKMIKTEQEEKQRLANEAAAEAAAIVAFQAKFKQKRH